VSAWSVLSVSACVEVDVSHCLRLSVEVAIGQCLRGACCWSYWKDLPLVVGEHCWLLIEDVYVSRARGEVEVQLWYGRKVVG
jgi:hypothetical protein